ncbi:hypothetical protein AB0M19_05580 [Streptomyces sp. NPDC051920]|uniref:DUF4760 domain-containing protein n=1 Tax=Streptomyces sp. NPDC051920 TaxID=3155523 RepID=UPI003415FEE9
MIFNVVSLLLSIAAAVTAVWSVYRQISRAKADSDLSMTTDLLLTHVRDKEFQQDQLWVLQDLGREHSPELGIEGLPSPSNYRLWNVGIVYEAVSIMLRYEITNPSIMLSLTQHRLIKTWEAVAPFVEAERARRGRVVFPFFEDAYAFAKEIDPDRFYQELGLRREDGSPRMAAPGAGGSGRSFTQEWRRWVSRRRPHRARGVARLGARSSRD